MALPALPDPLVLVARPSRVNFIVGPSGSGKTQTLANISRVTPRLMRYVTATALLHNDAEIPSLVGQDPVVEGLLQPPYGDGARRFGAIAVAIRGLTPNDVVLIDDLETTMHPELAKATTNFVLNQTTQAGVQVFIATHSLCVVDASLGFFPPQGANITLVRLSRQEPPVVYNETRLRSLRTPCVDVRDDVPSTQECGC